MRTSDRVYYIRLSEKTQGLVLNIYALLPGNGKNFPAAPNQHRTFVACPREPANTGPPPLPTASSHIHSKTACRGFKSFCPCHRTGENTGFSPVFFLHVLHGYGVHSGSDTGFSHLVLPVLNRPHPLQHPKRTRFRPFWTILGAFPCFCPLLTRKIFWLFFVHPSV